MFRAQVIGPIVAVLTVPVIIVGLYIFKLHSDLAASDRVIAVERAGRVAWQTKFEDLQRTDSENATALAACTAQLSEREQTPAAAKPR